MIKNVATPEIPGVMDGLIRITAGAGDTISGHILFGADGSGQFGHIEFVLTAEHARILAQGLLNGSSGQREATVPCSVGLQRCVRV